MTVNQVSATWEGSTRATAQKTAGTVLLDCPGRRPWQGPSLPRAHRFSCACAGPCAATTTRSMLYARTPLLCSLLSEKRTLSLGPSPTSRADQLVGACMALVSASLFWRAATSALTLVEEPRRSRVSPEA